MYSEKEPHVNILSLNAEEVEVLEDAVVAAAGHHLALLGGGVEVEAAHLSAVERDDVAVEAVVDLAAVVPVRVQIPDACGTVRALW